MLKGVHSKQLQNECVHAHCEFWEVHLGRIMVKERAFQSEFTIV